MLAIAAELNKLGFQLMKVKSETLAGAAHRVPFDVFHGAVLKWAPSCWCYNPGWNDKPAHSGCIEARGRWCA